MDFFFPNEFIQFIRFDAEIGNKISLFWLQSVKKQFYFPTDSVLERLQCQEM